MDWAWNGWPAVGAIATCVLALGVFVAIWQIIVTRGNTNKQLKETRKSTNAQLAVELFKQLRDPHLIGTLRDIVYNNKREAIKAFIDDANKKEEVRKIEHVIDRFDMLGALVAKDIVDKEIAIEAFAGPPALRCWYQLVLFMRELQKRRGFYSVNYEDFSRRSLEHFKDKKIEIWLRLEWERERIPLVKEFRKLVERRDELRPRSLEEIKQEISEERNNTANPETAYQGKFEGAKPLH